jgi:hypothetical protein
MSETRNDLSTARSSLPVTQRPRDRLRDQIRLDRELTDRVVARPKPRPAGNLALPGEPTPLRGNLDPVVTGAAMIHDHTAHAHSDLRGHRSRLRAARWDDQVRWVTACRPALAVLARTGHIATIQVLEATLPDNGAAVSQPLGQ